MSLASTIERFTRACRTGKLDLSLKADPKRMQIYLRFIRRTLEDTLKRAYPLTRHILSDEQWDEIVSDYLANVDCPSPFIWKAPEGFVSFVQTKDWSERFAIPYLVDLVDFEWLEIEMTMMPDCEKIPSSGEGDILEDPLFINPESCVVVYSYPVFEKKPLPRPMEKGIYPLLAFRHPEDSDVRFIALSLFYQRVLELLQENLVGRQALTRAATEFHLDEEKALTIGKKFLSDLRQQKALYQ